MRPPSRKLEESREQAPHVIQPEYGMKGLARGTGLSNPSREIEFSGADGDSGKKNVFPVPS